MPDHAAARATARVAGGDVHVPAAVLVADHPRVAPGLLRPAAPLGLVVARVGARAPAAVRCQVSRSAERAAPTRCTRPSSCARQPGGEQPPRVVPADRAAGPRGQVVEPVDRLGQRVGGGAATSRRSLELACPTRAWRWRSSGSPSETGACRKNRWWRPAGSSYTVQKSHTHEPATVKLIRRSGGVPGDRGADLQDERQPGHPGVGPVRVQQALAPRGCPSPGTAAPARSAADAASDARSEPSKEITDTSRGTSQALLGQRLVGPHGDPVVEADQRLRTVRPAPSQACTASRAGRDVPGARHHAGQGAPRPRRAHRRARAAGRARRSTRGRSRRPRPRRTRPRPPPAGARRPSGHRPRRRAARPAGRARRRRSSAARCGPSRSGSGTVTSDAATREVDDPVDLAVDHLPDQQLLHGRVAQGLADHEQVVAASRAAALAPVSIWLAKAPLATKSEMTPIVWVLRAAQVLGAPVGAVVELAPSPPGPWRAVSSEIRICAVRPLRM